MEMLDIINDDDEVVGQASRTDIYTGAHPHRVVHVVFQKPTGEIALQKRGITQSFLPGYWGPGVGGHVQTGETYEAAARREAREEVGETLDTLEFLGKHWYTFLYQDKPSKKIVAVFRTMWQDNLTPSSDEGDEIKFLSLTQIQDMIKSGEQFMPELLFILHKEFGIQL
jgi:isopentenyldiphosphate isomerase